MLGNSNRLYIILFCSVFSAFILFFLFKDASEIPPQDKNNLTNKKETVLNTKHRLIKATPSLPKTTYHTSRSDEFSSIIEAFKSWQKEYNLANEYDREKLLDKGLALAKERMPVMESKILEDPKNALKSAVSYKEYASLPKTIKPFIEEPFSRQAELVVMPIEARNNIGQLPQGSSNIHVYLETPINTTQLTLYGKRSQVLSKNQLPVQGVQLNNVSAIYDDPLQIVSNEDISIIQSRYARNKEATTQQDFLTGNEIIGDPVTAIAGGELFYFSSAGNVAILNDKLLALDKIINPHVSSQIIFSDSSAGNFNIVETISASLALPNSWTETQKRVFFIRVDFPDKIGEPITKQSLEEISNQASDKFREYSYGKVCLESTVSDQVIRLPHASSYYVPLGSTEPISNEKYRELLIDAEISFNNLNTGIDLTNFDINGVYTTEIGAIILGRASIGSGKRLLIHNSTNVGLFVHEIGHNFGLRHAHFWNTGGESVVGNGNTDEYGDIFDTMAKYIGHFHIQGKSRLNWLDNTKIQEVTESGSYRLSRFDHINADNLQGLKIQKGDNEYYWLGYRQEFTNNQSLTHGVYAIWQQRNEDGSISDRSWLIDTTPGSVGGKNDAAIGLGTTYSDTQAGIHITPIAKGGSEPNQWIDVQINIGDFSNNNNPTLTVAEIPTITSAREVITFKANGSDLDGDTLTYHWDFGDGVFITTNTANIQHYWTSGGAYTVTLTVSDMKGGVAIQQFEVTVSDALSQWVPRTSNTTTELAAVATKNNTMLLAVGDNKVIGSVDGENWALSVTNLGNEVHLNDIIFDYARQQWIVVGRDYDDEISDSVGAIFTSPDGAVWTKRFSGGNELLSLTGDSNLIVAVGFSGQILTSSNSVNWTSQDSKSTKDLYSIAYNGKGFVIATQAGILSSLDGITWGISSLDSFDYVSFLHSRFIASGNSSSGGIYYSINENNQFFQTNINTEIFLGFTYGRGIYFSSSLTDSTRNIISLDGITWYHNPTSEQPYRRDAIFFKDTFITVGNLGSIWQSDPISPLTDTDSDGLPDITDSDDDNDGLPDNFEINNALDSLNSADASLDYDNDGLTNLAEYSLGTNLYKKDTDNDGIPDNWEVQYNLNPLSANDAALDLDNDGLTNLAEFNAHSNPSINEPAIAIQPVLQLLYNRKKGFQRMPAYLIPHEN